MNLEIKATLHKALVHLQENVDNGESPEYGICSSIDPILHDIEWRLAGECIGLMNALMKQWPEGTGCDSYPVPMPKGVETSWDHFYHHEYKLLGYTRWGDDEYGKSRKELFLWLIKETE